MPSRLAHTSYFGMTGAGNGPRYAQKSPTISCTGYAFCFTEWMIASFFSGGVSRMLPSVSYSQPW